MGTRLFKKTTLLFAGILLTSSIGHAQFPIDEKEIMVSLRMIGHEVLLISGDSISRVLPIKKEEGRYRIQFESAFEFDPTELVSTVDRVVNKTMMANSYIVEVENCDTGEIVYSFKTDHVEQSDIIPCQGRIQPRSCYSVLFTIVPPKGTTKTSQNNSTGISVESEGRSYILYYVLFSALLLLVVGLILLKRKRKSASIDPNWIPLGQYYFDKRNTELIIEEQRIELTGKEADLLLLLYNSANTTVEREVILNMVWGDEGDYIGRTLDVFISKLRKKLEFDSKVKIVNTRGVGYKLILDV